jgi:hypothetical protein
MATILLNRRVDPIEPEIALGHRPLGKTTNHYAIYDPGYLGTIAAGSYRAHKGLRTGFTRKSQRRSLCFGHRKTPLSR